MRNFNNETYSSLVSDLLNDIFYVERSIRGQVSTIRQYAEVFVRRILDYNQDRKVTIGDSRIISELKEKTNNNILLINAIEVIRNDGNKSTHTQYVGNPTEEDLQIVIQSLFDLYAYLFIDYFEKYVFGKNINVMHSFSLLPPIIRFIVLDNLYKNDSENVHIIDRFTLAILKAFDKEKALDWLNKREEKFSSISSLSKEVQDELKNNYSEEYCNLIIRTSPNMYDLCLEKVASLSKKFEEEGVLYNDFESAIPYYEKDGKIDGDTLEIEAFNNLMEFVYMGRKAKKDLFYKIT